MKVLTLKTAVVWLVILLLTPLYLGLRNPSILLANVLLHLGWAGAGCGLWVLRTRRPIYAVAARAVLAIYDRGGVCGVAVCVCNLRSTGGYSTRTLLAARLRGRAAAFLFRLADLRARAAEHHRRNAALLPPAPTRHRDLRKANPNRTTALSIRR